MKKLTTKQLRKACKIYNATEFNNSSTKEHLVSRLLLKMSEVYNMGFSWCLGTNYISIDMQNIASGNDSDLVDYQAVCRILQLKGKLKNI